MIYLLPTDTCYWIACAISETDEYKRIYEVKKREYSKPLAIMVDSFKWLEENTSLNSKQIEFLQNYKNPFTVLCESDNLKHWINYEDEDWYVFENHDKYELIAFRVANLKEQKELIKETWPIFLTSANYSWEDEIYTISWLKEKFRDIKNLEIIWETNLNPDIKPSDIFEFVWESCEVKYLRKN